MYDEGMAKLYFRYGAMNSGKSTALMQVAFNYRERGRTPVIMKPVTDTKADGISSRVLDGIPADWVVNSNDDLISLVDSHDRDIDCILVDEAQFLTEQQVDDLFLITIRYNIPVIAYGLRGDFTTHSFPGSKRLMEVAHSLEELKTICRCGRKALFNGRIVDGMFVKEGDQVAIDQHQNVSYESLCGHCYVQKIGWSRPIGM